VVYTLDVGDSVIVTVPDPDGKPVRVTLPVGVVQSGWFTVPIVGGAIELTVMERGVALVFPQLVDPATESVPEVAPAAKVMVTALVPCPEDITAPVPEYDQVYVTPVKDGRLYATFACPEEQMVVTPVIVPSVGGTPIFAIAGVL